jgi:uncharacterized Zn-finger protein
MELSSQPEASVSLPPVKEPGYFRMKGCVNSSAGPDILEKRKIPYLCQNSNLGSSRPYPTYSTQYANPFPDYLNVFQFDTLHVLLNLLFSSLFVITLMPIKS